MPQRSDDPAVFERIHQWIRECTSLHKTCVFAEAPPLLPSRVVDVSNQAVKLKESGGLRAAYIALSHCWGSKTTLPTTVTTNIAHRMRDIPWSELSHTYQDAVTITRELGLQYLWIDSLCIIQDDPSDWDKESASMCSVYTNSFLTICATRSKDGRGGLFSDRYFDRGHPSDNGLAVPWNTGVSINRLLELATPSNTISPTGRDEGASQEPAHQLPGKPEQDRASQTHGYTVSAASSLSPFGKLSPEDAFVYARLQFDYHFKERDYSILDRVHTKTNQETEPLLTRAWAFQERLLSKRLIEYREEEVVWECQESRTCECKEWGEGTDLFHTTVKKVLHEQEVGGGFDRGILGNFFDCWTLLVETYTNLSLTFTSDRLPALSGLAQRMSSISKSTYLAGLWESDLPICLLWFPGKPSSSLIKRGPKPFFRIRSSDDTAPSWSWASGEGPILFERPLFVTLSEPVVKVIEVQYDPKGFGRFGHCSGGSLTLSGPVLEGVLEYCQDPYIRFWIVIGIVKLEVLLDFDVSSRDNPDFCPPNSPVWCIEVVHIESRGGPDSCGLILGPVKNSDNFKRLGCFSTAPIDFKQVHRFSDAFEGAPRKTLTII